MSEQKKNINCRVCLRYDLKGQKCFSLFENYNNSLIFEKIKYVADVQIREGDGLPSTICPDCLLQLETALVFKQKCETSNKILLSVLKQPSKICKVAFRPVPVKKEAEIVLDNAAQDPSQVHSRIGAISKTLERSTNEVAEIPTDVQPVHEVPITCQTKFLTISPLPLKCEELRQPADREFETVHLKLEHNTHEIHNEVPVAEPFENEGSIDEPSDSELVIDTDNNGGIDSEDHDEPENKQPETQGTVKKSKARDLKLICDDCGGSFRSKCKLAVHWKKVHQPEKLICPHCKRIFKSFKAYHVHAKKNTRSCYVATLVNIEGLGSDRIYHCRDCDYKTRNIKDIDAHLVTHSGDRRFQCKDCSKCFTQHASLQGHRESQHNDYKVEATCHYCGLFIKGRNKLYKHLRIHEPKSVKCEVCQKIFKSHSNLSNHMKRHNGVRGYTCEHCSANFFTMSELCNHRKKVHYKSKTFKCDLCEYSLYTAVTLKLHRAKHTHNNVVCLLCGMFLESAEKLALHQRNHNEKNFACQQCDKSFYRRDSLRRHILQKHGPPKREEPVHMKVVKIKQEFSADHRFDNVITLSPILS
ncbi:zinc finger protein 665 [Helicoverpa armigera]|uniref:zinc finger protein 665 n=1 Tax=Helicoverpa armigera TaxID=29058 RepID=UPI003083BF1F